MNHQRTITETLRRFALLDYRYQIEDVLTSLEPHSEATVSGLNDALCNDDSDVRLLAHRLLEELKSPTKQDGVLPYCDEPKLTVEQLVTLLREPHPDHDFFDTEEDTCDQQQLRREYSPDAIRHVALCELVEHRAKDAVPEILRLIECPSANEDVRLHAARAVFDITGTRQAIA